MIQAEKSTIKTNVILTLFVIVLTLVLSAEVFYLFFYKKQQTTSSTTIVENAVVSAKPQISNLYKKVPEADAKLVYDSIINKVDAVKTAYRNGVLYGLNITESYKSIITNIGNTQTTRDLSNGSKANFDFIIQFSNMAEEGKKDIGYLLTKKETSLVSAYKLQGDEEVPINLTEVRVGDLVSITVETDLLASPSNNLVSLKIVKLL